ncbi:MULTISPECIES: ABC transporter substrate-binding protein [unclassified Herbaspirillum]|uniref:ABC transporter substrate-binding protein n=1 Tax=unclassified Herbaspirillum TaxID=2624150 RepID=UPI001154CDB1|nr:MULTISPECIES: ABC transporter substrate-binding protein [unclassified Herbaspirillum]MBB5392332.1 branched-chain amino acid transport system substrate-binding protein [Herbaspirillum sp. SJZ102]TQK05973.1 amino acid/amide ABC transporter substrate-binding protein (HAAT family) [Herbaspirillum sp. SJZ130]TQK12549.1 amino acid/amide ABC transporter substrate-binding protein (HAAT family) [Herbaspirillum sp. SJZ106]
MRVKQVFKASLLASMLACAGAAHAELTIGVIMSLTGPGSGLGIPAKNGFALWPDSIGGEKVKLVVLDDATDPTQASKNARRLVAEDKVDLIIGSAAVPPTLAIADVALETQTVQLAISPIETPEGKDAWTFRLPQSTAVMAGGVVDQMKKQGVKTIGFLGYSDSYGENWLKEVQRLAPAAGIKVGTVERFSRADTSVTAQALRVVSANPDAVLVVASGSGAAMPHKALVERGYKGKIYQTHSAASRDLIRLGGKDVEGSFVVSGPAVVPEALPDSNPSKKLATDFVTRYEKQYGAGTRNLFAAHIYDAQLVLQKVVPEALKKAKPGTPAFRAALKDALENSGNIQISQGTLHYSAKDHFGLGDDARIMLTIQNGNWKAANP